MVAWAAGVALSWFGTKVYYIHQDGILGWVLVVLVLSLSFLTLGFGLAKSHARAMLAACAMAPVGVYVALTFDYYLGMWVLDPMRLSESIKAIPKREPAMAPP